MMIFLALSVSAVLGAAVGFGLGRLRGWVAAHEEQTPEKFSSKNPVLRARLRIRGIAVRGMVK